MQALIERGTESRHVARGTVRRGVSLLPKLSGRWYDSTVVLYRIQSLQFFSTPALTTAKRLAALDLGRIVLVPVPSSSCTSYRLGGAPFDMANAAQARMGRLVKVERWLRFAEKMTPSHDGGTRSVSVLMDGMRVAQADRTGAHVVLVDDVKTTGAHCKACAKKLRAHGTSVEIAIVAASTVWDRHPSPFKLEPEDIEEDFI